MALALFETSEQLRNAGDDGHLAFVVSALNFALATDQQPVTAASSEIIGRLLLASGNLAQGARMLQEFAIPALEAIGQRQRAETLRRLIS